MKAAFLAIHGTHRANWPHGEEMQCNQSWLDFVAAALRQLGTRMVAFMSMNTHSTLARTALGFRRTELGCTQRSGFFSASKANLRNAP